MTGLTIVLLISTTLLGLLFLPYFYGAFQMDNLKILRKQSMLSLETLIIMIRQKIIMKKIKNKRRFI